MSGKKRTTTTTEGRAWRVRWQRVNEYQRHELQSRSPLTKLRQLAVLMQSAQDLGWSKALRAEDAQVWQRWQELRKAHEAKNLMRSRRCWPAPEGEDTR